MEDQAQAQTGSSSVTELPSFSTDAHQFGVDRMPPAVSVSHKDHMTDDTSLATTSCEAPKDEPTGTEIPGTAAVDSVISTGLILPEPDVSDVKVTEFQAFIEKVLNQEIDRFDNTPVESELKWRVPLENRLKTEISQIESNFNGANSVTENPVRENLTESQDLQKSLEQLSAKRNELQRQSEVNFNEKVDTFFKGVLVNVRDTSTDRRRLQLAREEIISQSEFAILPLRITIFKVAADYVSGKNEKFLVLQEQMKTVRDERISEQKKRITAEMEQFQATLENLVNDTNRILSNQASLMKKLNAVGEKTVEKVLNEKRKQVELTLKILKEERIKEEKLRLIEEEEAKKRELMSYLTENGNRTTAIEVSANPIYFEDAEVTIKHEPGESKIDQLYRTFLKDDKAGRKNLREQIRLKAQERRERRNRGDDNVSEDEIVDSDSPLCESSEDNLSKSPSEEPEDQETREISSIGTDNDLKSQEDQDYTESKNKSDNTEEITLKDGKKDPDTTSEQQASTLKEDEVDDGDLFGMTGKVKKDVPERRSKSPPSTALQIKGSAQTSRYDDGSITPSRELEHEEDLILSLRSKQDSSASASSSRDNYSYNEPRGRNPQNPYPSRRSRRYPTSHRGSSFSTRGQKFQSSNARPHSGSGPYIYQGERSLRSMAPISSSTTNPPDLFPRTVTSAKNDSVPAVHEPCTHCAKSGITCDMARPKCARCSNLHIFCIYGSAKRPREEASRVPQDPRKRRP
jgi:hypothetical protein